MPIRHFAGAACAALLLAACATAPAPDVPDAPGAPATADAPAPETTPPTVAEAWETARVSAAELDSLATWQAPDGATWLFASAKSTDRVLVYDGRDGQPRRQLGGPGAAPGRFDRPNGLAVYADHLFVVERDNHRVQVFTLPALESLGSFGDEVLRSPYGLWINETEPGELEVYVTDSFMYGDRHDVVPPLHELDQRVRRFRVAFDHLGRLRAADESRDGSDGHGGSTLREYDLAGRASGRSLPEGSFDAEAEGVALWACPGGGGYWIAVDQLAPLTRFHLFDRATLAAAGSFQGQVTSHTDGIALDATASGRFPGGVLYAVNDDASITAFDLRDVAATLGLDRACTE